MGRGETKDGSVRREEWVRRGGEMDSCNQNFFISYNPNFMSVLWGILLSDDDN